MTTRRSLRLASSFHDLPLNGVRLLQNGMQGGDHGHAHFLEQGEQMAPGWSAEDSELMLDAEHIGVIKIKKVRGLAVGIEFLILEFEAHFGRVCVTLRAIV